MSGAPIDVAAAVAVDGPIDCWTEPRMGWLGGGQAGRRVRNSAVSCWLCCVLFHFYALCTLSTLFSIIFYTFLFWFLCFAVVLHAFLFSFGHSPCDCQLAATAAPPRPRCPIRCLPIYFLVHLYACASVYIESRSNARENCNVCSSQLLFVVD